MRPGSIEYDPILADEILERLADGDSLASICCEQGMPNERSVRRWARNQGDFGARYAAARRLGYEKRADEMLEIADDSSADWIESDGGGKVLNSVHVNRMKGQEVGAPWMPNSVSSFRRFLFATCEIRDQMSFITLRLAALSPCMYFCVVASDVCPASSCTSRSEPPASTIFFARLVMKVRLPE
jgi:hypothetical protein